MSGVSPPRLPIARPALGEEEAAAAREAILSGWVTQGPRVARFEEEFARWVGAAHAAAVSSGTAALHLALAAVGVRPGDVVITVSHSFIATANAIRHCGAEPVFVDIEQATPNMDPAALERCLADDFELREGAPWHRNVSRLCAAESRLAGRAAPVGRLSAILLVHQVGMPADVAAIGALARHYQVPLVEDAACAIGAEVSGDAGRSWERVGRPHGEIACFSFHPRKVITTGDGGMLTTSVPEYDRRVRLLRHHGMDTPDFLRHGSQDVVIEGYAVTGYNYRMTDIQAAVGLVQLGRLPELLAERRELAEAYARRLAGISLLTAPSQPRHARANWQSYIVTVADGVDVTGVMRRLKARGIDTRPGVMCAHLEPPYAAAWPAGSLPRSERARDRGIILPLFPGMTGSDVDRVCGELGKALHE